MGIKEKGSVGKTWSWRDGLISIIVPVYNAERSLKRCIESVIQQTYGQWELLLVDDGSMDASYAICESYRQADSRILCFHTENSGCVHARKVGMKQAKGNILAFLDSDDWIEKDALQYMQTKLQESQADCVIAGYIEEVGTKEKVIVNRMRPGKYQKEKLQKEFFPYMLSYSHFFAEGIQPFLWNKLFKRQIIEDILLNIDEKITIGEDAVCVFPAFLRADSIFVLDKAFYHYCIHPDSAMKNYRTPEEEVENIRRQYYSLQAIFANSPYAGCLLSQLRCYILHHLMVRAFSSVIQGKEKTPFFMFGAVPVGSKVILYGAGAFGRAIIYGLRGNKESGICAWCDKESQKYQKMGYPVEPISFALKKRFDYLLLAVMDEKTAEEIREELVAYGVEKEKMIWLDVQYLEEADLAEFIPSFFDGFHGGIYYG